MIELRPYQQDAIARIRQAFAQQHRAVLFVLPTGGGKSYTFCAITQGAAFRGNRVCILVHRQELLRQASANLTIMGIRHGVIAAGRSMDLSLPVQVASVATLARRLRHIPPDLFGLLVVDEAHHSNASTWATVLSHCSSAKVLGVTATPCRGDGRGLGEHYEAMILGPTPAWLTEEGYLAPARVLAPPIGFDPRQVSKRMGDFRMDQAAEQLGRQQVGDAIGHYLQHLEGQTAIAFCCSVAHAEAVAEAFRERGVAAASIDGTTKNRAELLDQLGEGSLMVLTSCELIGEGIDVPSVGGCILLRPTQSEALHLQMIGRCLRPQSGKTAVILDHVGNVQRLGHHLEEREWSLDGKRQRHREKAEAVKVCAVCFSCLRSGLLACPECGHEFESQERRRLLVVDGTLQEISVEQARRVRLREQASATTVEELVEVGRRRGMKNPYGWARHVMGSRQAKGHWRRVR
ncbi:MAG: DEAD/DEAH box helicase [Cyanobacteriota bacterium]|nr:DEAD/DEAH box helicase [Cyanobacteriota bacterium]